MEIFDISVPITNGLVTWPGDPPVKLSRLTDLTKGDESNLSYLQMCVHTGTHIDAPNHYLIAGKTTEHIPFEKLIGEALVVNIDPGVDVITEKILREHPRYIDILRSKKIFFHTRNSNLWVENSESFTMNFVGIDTSGAKYLTENGIELIGIDYLSIAPYHETLEPHQILLSNEVVILEGLNLSDIEEGYYQLICLPLKIPGCEGAPTRAILMK